MDDSNELSALFMCVFFFETNFPFKTNKENFVHRLSSDSDFKCQSWEPWTLLPWNINRILKNNRLFCNLIILSAKTIKKTSPVFTSFAIKLFHFNLCFFSESYMLTKTLPFQNSFQFNWITLTWRYESQMRP